MYLNELCIKPFCDNYDKASCSNNRDFPLRRLHFLGIIGLGLGIRVIVRVMGKGEVDTHVKQHRRDNECCL